MADEPYFLRSLCLAGFRAYLQPKKFDFTSKRSLAIFAPNGSGKSSVIDALEFMFSEEGTLERLGRRTMNNQAGPAALAHNLADEMQISPVITIEVIKDRNISSGRRSAVGARRPIPEIAKALNRCFVVSPIVRGHALRTFVEGHSPEQRYADVAGWLKLGPLVEVQKNLRALRAQVNAAAEDDASLRRIESQIVKETNGTVRAWDAAAILVHINGTDLAPLDSALEITALDAKDPGYAELERRVKAEQNKLGLAGLRQIRQSAAVLWELQDSADSTPLTVGAIPTFEAAVANLASAETTEAEERSKASSAAFQTLWKAAEPLFAEGAVAPEACPVCATPLAATAAGSAAGVLGHIHVHLAELADYAAAKTALDAAKAAATTAHTHLAAAAAGLIGVLGESEAALKTCLVAYQAAIADWSHGASPRSSEVVEEVRDLLRVLTTAILEIETKQGDLTYSKAKAKVDRLLELQRERGVGLRTRAELTKLSQSLQDQAATISGEFRKKIQMLLDRVQIPMNDIYRQVQGAGAVPIRLELPPEDDTNQQRLQLVIDFAKNRTGVQPGGYLSDSQIHSVALALRLAAIRRFNTAAPVIALDDIVTSYDADHRRTISGLLSAISHDSQVLITTHDERFFSYLKDQLDATHWAFTRIVRLDPNYGPRFADHRVSDEMIEARWTEGQSAANEMRQAEEEWLLSICRGFGVSVPIRPLEKAYSYERSELASALAGFLRESKLEPAAVPGVANRFLSSMQKGEIENFGSHFQDGPYGDGSIGDEKARWTEFKAFRGQFACEKCGRTKFKRPMTLKRPVCAHEGCEVQFEFNIT